MRLDDWELEAAYYGLAAYVRQQNIASRRIPDEVGRLFARVETCLRLSQARHESGCGTPGEEPSEVWIGTKAVAAWLGIQPRQVQRHATEIGGQLIGGRLFFRESDVADYAERQATHARTDT